MLMYIFKAQPWTFDYKHLVTIPIEESGYSALDSSWELQQLKVIWSTAHAYYVILLLMASIYRTVDLR